MLGDPDSILDRRANDPADRRDLLAADARAGRKQENLLCQLFLFVDQDVPHWLLLAGFIAIMAAWAVREHLRNPPRRP